MINKKRLFSTKLAHSKVQKISKVLRKYTKGMFYMKSDLAFMIIACIILVSAAFFIPKRLKKYELYATVAFATALGFVADTVLALKYKFYTLSEEGVQLGPIFGQILLYSSANILVLNYFPYKKSLKYKVAYIIAVTILTLLFEVIASMFGFIRYNEWNIWYSALSYPILTVIIILNLLIFQRMVKQNN
jgi:hypothetical protein